MAVVSNNCFVQFILRLSFGVFNIEESSSALRLRTASQAVSDSRRRSWNLPAPAVGLWCQERAAPLARPTRWTDASRVSAAGAQRGSRRTGPRWPGLSAEGAAPHRGPRGAALAAREFVLETGPACSRVSPRRCRANPGLLRPRVGTAGTGPPGHVAQAPATLGLHVSVRSAAALCGPQGRPRRRLPSHRPSPPCSLPDVFFFIPLLPPQPLFPPIPVRYWLSLGHTPTLGKTLLYFFGASRPPPPSRQPCGFFFPHFFLLFKI